MLKKSASALKRGCLVRLVHLVDLVQPTNKPEKPDEPDKPDPSRSSRLSREDILRVCFFVVVHVRTLNVFACQHGYFATC